MFPISSSKAAALAERMRKLGIREADLDEAFVRSGGKGGQNVNKVSTCVVLVHTRSGLAVKCQRERTQALNRYRARVMLADKIEKQILGERSAAAARTAKIQRQKRRRSRKAKEKLLHDKRARAEVKARRKPVRDLS
jgi:protein subunit release factor B